MTKITIEIRLDGDPAHIAEAGRGIDTCVAKMCADLAQLTAIEAKVVVRTEKSEFREALDTGKF